MAGKVFASVRLDIAARGDELVSTEKLQVPSALPAFDRLSPPQVEVAAPTQHFAEKLHALTRDHGDRLNTRVRDLVDLMLLIELAMLGNLVLVISKSILGGEGVLHNATLESITVHARALYEFFYGDNPRSEDAVADDFLGGEGRWTDLRGAAAPILESVRRRVGTEIAHLTYGRLEVTPEAKEWSLSEIMRAFDEVLGTFLRNVPAERLGPNWPPRQD